MERVTFNTFKAASKLPLNQIALYFNLDKDVSWKEYIKIDNEKLGQIYSYELKDKAVFLYKYGCITFVNFRQHEINYFFEYLSKIYIELDDRLISKFSEDHVIRVSNKQRVKLWKSSDEDFEYDEILIDIVATVLTKSIELYKIETELNIVLDEAEKLINYLNAGRLRANTKKVVSIIAQCTRFKYRTIESVRLLGRPPEFGKSIHIRRAYEVLSNFFELDDRYLDLQSRTDVLDSITEEYFEFKHKQSERRLLMFEILLLAIFPLMYFI